MSAPISKRRPGPHMGGPPVADPRPQLDGDQVLGVRCGRCGYPAAPATPWCPQCHSGELEPARFGPLGTVWSSTVVHIPVGRWVPPYAIAYVDLDQGPRVLAHLEQCAVLAPGRRVRIGGASEQGDILARAEDGNG